MHGMTGVVKREKGKLYVWKGREQEKNRVRRRKKRKVTVNSEGLGARTPTDRGASVKVTKGLNVLKVLKSQ